MPYKIDSLDQVDVQRELAHRGYGFHGNRNAGIHLTVPHKTEKFKTTGAAKRIPLIPVKVRDYEEILQRSRNVVEAADQIEQLSTGRILSPTVGGGSGTSASLDPAAIERMIESRLANAVEEATRPISQRMADQESTIEDQKATIEKLQKQLKEKKPARRVTKRRSTKSKIVAEAAKAVEQTEEDARKANANSDVPELTPEQEAMLRSINLEGQGGGA